MPTVPFKGDFHFDFPGGWVVVTNGTASKDPTQEASVKTVHSAVRRRLAKMGYDVSQVLVLNETTQLAEWEARRTRKPFVKPTGMFIFRLVDTSGEQGIGRTEISQWPVK